MRKCFFVVLVVAYPVVLNAQEGIPADFWDSRVSVAFYPEVRVTVGELSESINTEVDGCDWRDSDGTNIFLMECLVSRGLTEVLLQFVFDWRSAQRVSRLEAYEGFSGEKFDDPMLALLMLAPPTPASEEEIEQATRWAEEEQRANEAEEAWAARRDQFTMAEREREMLKEACIDIINTQLDAMLASLNPRDPNYLTERRAIIGDGVPVEEMIDEIARPISDRLYDLKIDILDSISSGGNDAVYLEYLDFQYSEATEEWADLFNTCQERGNNLGAYIHG